MLKKIIKKDNNEELEKILEKKDIDEQAKNLLQGILYKIEVSYNDYQKAKGIEQTQEQYVEQLLTNIKKKCNKIRVVRISQKFDEEEIQKQLKNKKYYVGEQESNGRQGYQVARQRRCCCSFLLLAEQDLQHLC